MSFVVWLRQLIRSVDAAKSLAMAGASAAALAKALDACFLRDDGPPARVSCGPSARPLGAKDLATSALEASARQLHPL
eukprot:11196195-Alexandrium_andersonii.AAC.1